MYIIHCRLSTTQHSGEIECLQTQQITAADLHWRIKSFVHWKHVHLVYGLGTCFPNKFGLRVFVWDQTPVNILATRHTKNCP